MRYPTNIDVFGQGEDAHSFFLLLHGHVRAAKRRPNGQQIVVRYVTSGEIFGVAVAIGLTRYPATATAVDDSVVLAWPRAWPRMVEKHPALAGNTLQTVGTRLQETPYPRHRDVNRAGRAARGTCSVAPGAAGGTPGRIGIEIDFPISRQDIAEMTGTTLHTVSRILSGWEDQGLVEGGRQRIVIRDPHKLFTLAED